jgi:3-oxoacyl-(acyl-carrier-protein) synthase
MEDIKIPTNIVIKKEWFRGLRFGFKSVISNMIDELITPELRETIRSASTTDSKCGLIFSAGNAFNAENHSDKDGLSDKIQRNFKFNLLTISNVWAGKVANDLRFTDFVMTDATACISSANAVMLAKMMMDAGKLDKCVIVSIENPISFGMLNGFTDVNACLVKEQEDSGILPSAFDSKNFGFNIGLGCGLMLLESERVVDRSKIVAEVLSSSTAGERNENYIGQDPNGAGYKAAILDSLKDAKIDPNSIDIIKSHGSGTQVNNQSESSAINDVFRNSNAFVTGYKQYIGHTFGPSFCIETLMLIDDIKSGKVRKIPNRTEKDDFFISEDKYLDKKETYNVCCLSSGMANVFNSTILTVRG